MANGLIEFLLYSLDRYGAGRRETRERYIRVRNSANEWSSSQSNYKFHSTYTLVTRRACPVSRNTWRICAAVTETPWPSNASCPGSPNRISCGRKMDVCCTWATIYRLDTKMVAQFWPSVVSIRKMRANTRWLRRIHWDDRTHQRAFWSIVSQVCGLVQLKQLLIIHLFVTK